MHGLERHGERTRTSGGSRRNGLDPALELTGPSDPTREDDRLCTLLFQEALDRQLRRIYEQTRLAFEETGVHTLYCTFGLLEWYETGSSTQASWKPRRT